MAVRFGQLVAGARLLYSGDIGTLRNQLWVRWYNLDLDYVSSNDLGFSESTGHFHSATPFGVLRPLLRELSIGENDAILDFGCGKGAALAEFARWPFAKVAGCDLSPDLLRTAQFNLNKLGHDRVKLYCADATKLIELNEYTYFYFFNPFPEPVMDAVVRNIIASRMARPRQIVLLYRNPTCHDVVIRSGGFSLCRSVSSGQHVLNVYKTVT